MSSKPRRRPTRAALVHHVLGIAAAGVCIAALTACSAPFAPSFSAAQSPTPTPSLTASASATPTPSVSPSGSAPAPTPSVSASAAGASTPVTTSCLALVSLQTMYAFDPNFGLTDRFTPSSGSLQSAALAYKGVACRWSQQTSGEKIDISVAHPSSSALAALRASGGAPVGGSGRFFRTAGGIGTIQQFSGPYWIVASSSYFSSTADAAPLLDSVTKALG